MALTTIEYGSVASSETLNNNFTYLSDLVASTISTVEANTSSLLSQISTLNANITSKINEVDEIGLPIPTLQSSLRDNEVWLEGALVSRTTYSNLFSVYGTTYGEGDGELTFQLPYLRDRVIWGSSDETYGYIEAGLPNHTHTLTRPSVWGNYNGAAKGSWCSDNGGGASVTVTTSTASNSIYGNSDTVQPPAIKVRWKTRYA